MHHAIAVGKELCLGFVWGMFIVFFQISTVIIYEYPDIPALKFFAALHPYNLSVMIAWLHTITANIYPELGTSRNATGRHLYLLEHFTLKKRPSGKPPVCPSRGTRRKPKLFCWNVGGTSWFPPHLRRSA